MSALGRLWRRAPAWRLTLAAAVGLTALAAMFPPAHLPWPVPFGKDHPPAGKDEAPLPRARFVPQPEPKPSDYGVVAFPPLGPGRTGIIPFAGRQLPLPAGSWQELVLARSGGAAPEPGMLLVRIAAGRVTGLLLAAGSGPLGDGSRVIPSAALCFDSSAIAHRMIPVPSAEGPLAHECWTLMPVNPDDADSPARTDDVLRGGFDRLARMGLSAPRRMLALRYLRTNDNGWLTALLLLPDRTADHALQAWIPRYVGALHKGFDGTLRRADLTAAVVRDPE